MACLHWVRLVALLSSCVALGLVIHVGGLEGGVGVWCVFCWAFSITSTFQASLVEILYVNMNIHVFWLNISATLSSYAALLCLSTSIMFPHSFLTGHQNYDVHNHRVAAEIFSCVATLMHLTEAWIGCVRMNCYMASTQGLLQVCQTYVAGFIFFFISNPVSYTDQAGVRWCMAVYCICFIWSVAGILRCLFCNGRDLACMKNLHVCAPAMYLSATIIWPVFKLNSHYTREIYPLGSCQYGLGLCPWGSLVVVAVLTAINFFLYSCTTWCLCVSERDDQQHITISAMFTMDFKHPSEDRMSGVVHRGRWISFGYQSLT